MDTKSPLLPQQPLVLLIALLFWGLCSWVLGDDGTWLSALVAYLLALGLVNFVMVWFPSALAINSLAQRRFAFFVLALAGFAAAGRTFVESNPAKELATVRENLADRLALENLPSIAPALLVTHEPQRFFVYAPGNKAISVRWTASSQEVKAVDLGRGVFVLDFDPRTDATLAQVKETSLTCTLIADGAEHRRMLNFVRPQAHPRQVRSAPEAGLAATVSEETDELILVRRDGSCQRISVGDGPTDCGIIGDGKQIAVVHRFTPEIWIVDAADGNIVKKLSSRPFQTRIAVDGQTMAIACGGEAQGVLLFRLPELNETHFQTLRFAPDCLEFVQLPDLPTASLVVTDRHGRAVHCLRPTEGNNWQFAAQPLFFPRPITAIGRMPEPGQLALATTASQVTAEQPRANHFLENTIHTLDVPRWEIVATQVTDRRGLRQDSPGDTEHGISPLALATIDGRLFAAFAGSNEVGEVSANSKSNQAPRYVSLDPYPLFGPQGLADLGDGLWCVTSPSQGTIGVFDRSGALQSLLALAPADDELENERELARRNGERTFFEGTRAGLACQSCHLESATDFCLHDIGQGKSVDVLSVRGIIGTSPYLRDASHWRLQELHEVAAVGYRDYPRSVPWDRAPALAEYLNSLPPAAHPKYAEKLNVERLRAGVDAFFQADCATCHTPPAFTNLGQHSAVGLFPDYYGKEGLAPGSDVFFDTPSLRGIALTAPYLHNGRAPTLRAVLTDWNKTGRHGNTRGLSTAQVEDLLYLLERL